MFVEQCVSELKDQNQFLKYIHSLKGSLKTKDVT